MQEVEEVEDDSESWRVEEGRRKDAEGAGDDESRNGEIPCHPPTETSTAEGNKNNGCCFDVAKKLTN